MDSGFHQVGGVTQNRLSRSRDYRDSEGRLTKRRILKPVKHSAAVVIFNGDRILAIRRPDDAMTNYLELLNTYYCAMPALRPPEAIFLFSTPFIRSVARRFSAALNHLFFRRMYWWQVGRFFRDAETRNQFVPLLYQQFDDTPSARPAFFRLNEDLLPTIRAGSETAPKLKKFSRPVRIIFGASDPYLNSGVARRFYELLLGSIAFSDRRRIPLQHLIDELVSIRRIAAERNRHLEENICLVHVACEQEGSRSFSRKRYR